MNIELATAKLLERCGHAKCYNRYTKNATTTQAEAMRWLRTQGIRFNIDEYPSFCLGEVSIVEQDDLEQICEFNKFATYEDACEELIVKACKYIITKKEEELVGKYKDVRNEL